MTTSCPACRLSSKIEAGGVEERDALPHQLLGLASLIATLQLGELDPIVDAHDLENRGRTHGLDRDPVRDRHRDHVGQVILPLRVLVLETRHPSFQMRGRHGHHAGIDLADRALLRARVPVFDDPLHTIRRIPDDASVARGIGKLDRQQRQAPAVGCLDEAVEGLRGDERDIAIKDEDRVARIEPDSIKGRTWATAWPVPSCRSCSIHWTPR